MKANLDLHIEELLLRGLPDAQRARIAAAVQSELQRLLAEGDLPPALAGGIRLPEVQLGELKIAPSAKPAAIGAQIAGAIYTSLVGGSFSASQVGGASSTSGKGRSKA